MSEPITVGLAIFSYGGLTASTFDCLLREVAVEGPRQGLRFALDHYHTDALVSRARSIAATRFLRRIPESPLLFMLDHDLDWHPGDVCRLVKQALAVGACVAGLYSCRKFGGGHASVLERDDVQFRSGNSALHSALYLGGGFLAIPRAILEAVVGDCGRDDAPADLRIFECDDVEETFYDFFRPVSVIWEGAKSNRTRKSPYVYLSEDWAFSYRVRSSGGKLYVWEGPALLHHGSHGFSVADGS